MTQTLFSPLRFFAASLALLIYVHTASAEVRGYWQMDDGVQLTASDSSGFGNDGQIQSAIWALGVHNAALQINRGGTINCGSDESLNIQDAITLEAWAKPWSPRYPDTPTLLRKEGAYALHLGPTEAASMTLWLNGKEERISADLEKWPNGQWRHIVGTFDGRTMKIYINGKLANEKPVAAGAKISTSRSPLYLGSARKRMPFSGTLDEVRVAARAFTPEEIVDTFRNGMFQVYRANNKFTDFYEKFRKREIEEVVPGILWIDTEDFDDYGGWWMDTQFVPRMGSPYLMAAGLYQTVENAKTTVDIPEPGTYRLWVRNKNWLAQGHAPGQFNVLVNGQAAETVFGAHEQRAWIWQDGGTFELNGEAQIELEDLTGYYGRCDAIILARDLDFNPKQEQEDYLGMRKQYVGELPVKDMGHFDFIVVGAGVAGCNAAIAAARGGATVALIQDRPLVGGNNSSEMGVPVSGGSSTHRGRETGLNEEAGRLSSYHYHMKWAAGAEMLLANEPNITVFLNTHVFEAETDENKRIKSVTAFNMLDGHHTRYTADYFADCTGDGWLGYYAGNEYMLGRENKEAFNEPHAKDVASNITMSGSLMQHSILGYQAIDMGEPVKHEPQPWIYDMRGAAEGYVKRPKYELGIRAGNWWTENHGRNDDLWDPEWARDDLIMASLSYYNWIKNHSPLVEEAANYRLTYIPVTNAKRETRRLVGDLIVNENHLVNREVFPDRVGYFVWMLDVHHPLGIFSPGSPFDYDVKISPASIPFRCLYARDVPNMFMAGRNVSVTAVALGTARVQGTTGMMGQIIGTAAAMCVEKRRDPRGIYESHIGELQQQLMKDDITILHMENTDPGDLARTATISASSSISPEEGPDKAINGIIRPLDDDMEMWVNNPKVPSNKWVSDPNQPMPQWLALNFGEKKTVNSVYLTFDTNLFTKRYITWEFKTEHRMPPECVRDYQVQIHDGSAWVTVAEAENNYMRRRVHRFPAVETDKVRVLITSTNGDASARVYEIRAYNEVD